MYKHKNAKFAIGILVISFLLAILFFVIEQMKENEVLQLYRKEHGEGTQVEELRVSVGDNEQMDIQIEVQERAYTKEELQEVFAESLDNLDVLILGENETLDRVEKPLRLIESIPNTGIKVTWELDRYDVMNIDGELQAEKIDVEGTLVQLRAVLSYGEQEVAQVLHVMLYPPKNDERAMQELALRKEIEEINGKTKESETFLLPKTIQGNAVQWERQESSNAYLILLFGVVGAVYMLLHEKEKQKKIQKERAEQMLVDYPEILNQFALLLGAGISVKNVWYRIVQQYQERKREKGTRYAYEEMSYTYRELQSRVMETECYEKFGKRCQVQQYVKLGTILSQNLRKGSAGLTKLLTLEAKMAFEERKHRAKRLGEEAGTKLLLPMFLMLLIVLLIVVIPAFFSFHLA
jgi:Bacterial type II secretion system protein F domain.